ncbi:17068_t:CDS:2, partial [Dentiscutata erythropus]
DASKASCGKEPEFQLLSDKESEFQLLSNEEPEFQLEQVLQELSDKKQEK